MHQDHPNGKCCSVIICVEGRRGITFLRAPLTGECTLVSAAEYCDIDAGCQAKGSEQLRTLWLTKGQFMIFPGDVMHFGVAAREGENSEEGYRAGQRGNRAVLVGEEVHVRTGGTRTQAAGFRATVQCVDPQSGVVVQPGPGADASTANTKFNGAQGRTSLTVLGADAGASERVHHVLEENVEMIPSLAIFCSMVSPEADFEDTQPAYVRSIGVTKQDGAENRVLLAVQRSPVQDRAYQLSVKELARKASQGYEAPVRWPGKREQCVQPNTRFTVRRKISRAKQSTTILVGADELLDTIVRGRDEGYVPGVPEQFMASMKYTPTEVERWAREVSEDEKHNFRGVLCYFQTSDVIREHAEHLTRRKLARAATSAKWSDSQEDALVHMLRRMAVVLMYGPFGEEVLAQVLHKKIDRKSRLFPLSQCAQQYKVALDKAGVGSVSKTFPRAWNDSTPDTGVEEYTPLICGSAHMRGHLLRSAEFQHVITEELQLRLVTAVPLSDEFAMPRELHRMVLAYSYSIGGTLFWNARGGVGDLGDVTANVGSASVEDAVFSPTCAPSHREIVWGACARCAVDCHERCTPTWVEPTSSTWAGLASARTAFHVTPQRTSTWAALASARTAVYVTLQCILRGLQWRPLELQFMSRFSLFHVGCTCVR